MPGFTNPMLFSDDDGRLFFYWGCTQSGGIWGAELNATNPASVLTTPKELIHFDPVANPWEAVGDWNQNTTAGWVEGSWMVKHGGKYFLTFSAAGTENRTYAMGACTSISPLGPFTPQKRNPFFRNTDGLVTGTGHGCVVAGPEDRLWVFYTIHAAWCMVSSAVLGVTAWKLTQTANSTFPQRPRCRNGCRERFQRDKKLREPGWLPVNGGMPSFA